MIARLSEEKTRYQQQQYQHSIQLAAQEANLQKQRYELTSLVSQLQDTEKLLGEMTEVRAAKGRSASGSPYNGTVRRVKVLGQSDRVIKVEVVLEVSDRF